MLLIQEYLKTHSFSELETDHGVFVSFSKDLSKISLNYGQLEAKDSDSLAQQCRGIILSNKDMAFSKDLNKIVGDTIVVAYGMNRFFNYGQGAAANIDWDKSSIREKLDGSCIFVYWFNDSWHCATRSVPDADLLMDDKLQTFSELFHRAVFETTGKAFNLFTSTLDKTITYVFELTTPKNRIVVKYDDYRCTLIAARDIVSMKELNIYELNIDVPKVKEFKFSSINDMLDWVSIQSPMDYEGVVVVDHNFNRLKVKNANYVAYNKIRDQLSSSDRNCVRLILNEKEDDVLPMLSKEMADKVLDFKSKLALIIKEYDSLLLLLKDKNFTMKEVALYIADINIWSAPIFNILNKKSSSMKDFLMKNKKDGDWADSFLSKIVEIIKEK